MVSQLQLKWGICDWKIPLKKVINSVAEREKNMEKKIRFGRVE